MAREFLFTVDENKESNPLEITIKNNRTKEFTSIIPEFGGRLKELWLNNGKNNISVLRKVVNINTQNRDDLFTNAKLSPFAGRIKDAQFLFKNITYKMKKNFPEEGNACHGFIYSKRFHVVERGVSDKSARCTLRYVYEKGDDGYPFQYSIDLTYELSQKHGLTCVTKVVNNSETEIPIGDGWHHYFDLGVDISELNLKINALSTIELDATKIPTGKRAFQIPFKDLEKIGKHEIDSCFLVKSNSGETETRLVCKARNIDLHVWQETGPNKYNYVIIYTPPDRKSIAIEPISSNINSFNSGEDLIILSPGEEFVSKCGIYLRKE